jgi:HEPN domain-containing protein
MPGDRARIKETKRWLVRAAEDLRAAEHGFGADPPLLGTIVFHCQQAAEKSVKAFLVWYERPFRKTHDLVELGQQCVGLDASLEPLLRKAAPLTEYAWKFRYPGEPEEPSREEAHEALAIAREVYDAIVTRLPAEVRP